MISTATLKEIQEKQKLLDFEILKSNNVDISKIKEKRKLAFIIEVSEFLNEEKSFKYWKKNIQIDREKLTEEYIDGIHFLMSIINEKNIDLSDYEIKEPISNESHIIALNLLNDMTNFWKTDDIKYLWNVIDYYLSFTKLLSISEKEFIESYNNKNKINRDRIKNGY